jgi:HEAT repeat protein
LALLLHDGDHQLVLAAVRALGNLGSIAASAAEPLLRLVFDKKHDHGLRVAAAEALGRLGPVPLHTLDRLLLLLRDEEWHVRQAAAKLLGRPGPFAPHVAEALTALLDDEDAQVRRHAAEALGGLGSAAAPAMQVLAQLLQDRKTREAAAIALAEMGTSITGSAVNDLLRVYRDEDPEVRRIGARALARLFSFGVRIVDGKPTTAPALAEAVQHRKPSGARNWFAIGPKR